MRLLIVICLVLTTIECAAAGSGGKKKEFSKYSKEANEKLRPHHDPNKLKRATSHNRNANGENDTAVTGRPAENSSTDGYDGPPKNYSTSTERLFRMQKIQNIWQKGQKILNEMKLKALFHDLKTHDKREVEFKKIKARGKDKDGLQEAGLRAQLSAIVESYGLLGSFPEHEVRAEDGFQIDRMFKDKKLNKLWNKIEEAGLDEKEMKILKEELEHHQTKVDQYYAFVDNLHERREKTSEVENSVEHFLEDEVVTGEHDQKKKNLRGKDRVKNKSISNENESQRIEKIRVKHLELKDDFDTLADKVRAKLSEQEFTNAKAVRLWEMAKRADFTKEELSSLRAELNHFEHRMNKLHYFTSELESKQNPDEARPLKNKVAELQHKIEKIHNELRGRIARRTEL